MIKKETTGEKGKQNKKAREPLGDNTRNIKKERDKTRKNRTQQERPGRAKKEQDEPNITRQNEK